MTVNQSGTTNNVDVKTLDKKLMMGYQGWFACPPKTQPNGGALQRPNSWWHWFQDKDVTAPVNSIPVATNLTVDMWPDTTDLDDVYPTSMEHSDGRTAMLYSAFDESTVNQHFKWMQTYNLDGVMLQRFVSELGDTQVKAFRDQVAENVRAGAEACGRAFCIMYDISNSNESTFVDDLKNDWIYLVGSKKITESPSYLKHNHKPLLAIWGLGFKDPTERNDHPGTASQATDIITYFKNEAQVTLLGGVPTYWATPGFGDSKSDQPGAPQWLGVYTSFDVLSPWSVNRYTNNQEADDFMKKFIIPERSQLQKLGKDYMPVVFPGYSATNHGDGTLNGVPRLGGNFWWSQVYNAVDIAGCTMIYGAMFDEVNEGTAMFKLADDLPTGTQGRLVSRNIDQTNLPASLQNLPSYWYLQLAGEANRRLRNGIKLTPNMPTPADLGNSM